MLVERREGKLTQVEMERVRDIHPFPLNTLGCGLHCAPERGSLVPSFA